jgi:O-antigen ligase
MPMSTFNVDTGMEFPAKFGLVGVVALVGMSVALATVFMKAAVTIRAETSWTSLVAFSVIGAVYFLFASPIEDKGFSFGMILLLALLLADYRSSPRMQHIRNPKRAK